MDPQEHLDAEPESERSRAPGGDVLRDLEARLSRASEAAERLLAQASARAARSGPPRDSSEPESASGDRPRDEGHPPAAGWQAPDREAPGSGRELELLIGILTAARDLVPPELQQRLAEALRELLLAIRALIDWYLERVEGRHAAPSEVEDIPIQ